MMGCVTNDMVISLSEEHESANTNSEKEQCSFFSLEIDKYGTVEYHFNTSIISYYGLVTA